jgi:hypothetical protein
MSKERNGSASQRGESRMEDLVGLEFCLIAAT